MTCRRGPAAAAAGLHSAQTRPAPVRCGGRAPAHTPLPPSPIPLPPAPATAPASRFDNFYKHDALTQLLHDYAEAYPGLVSVASIGKSFEGRDIWLATVTHTSTGAAADKPAFWADGNSHAADLTASTAVLYYRHQLVPGHG